MVGGGRLMSAANTRRRHGNARFVSASWISTMKGVHMRNIPHWIDGVPVADGNDVIDVTDPATDRPVATVHLANRDTVDAAVAAAAAAFDAWSQTSLSKRAQVLFRFRDLLLQNRSELAAIITAEHGKTLDDAAGEITRAADSVELACASRRGRGPCPASWRRDAPDSDENSWGAEKIGVARNHRVVCQLDGGNNQSNGVPAWNT
jgi:acyl-CoA reductase-like NAD-dependent aldehyde dehydrogenase